MTEAQLGDDRRVPALQLFVFLVHSAHCPSSCGPVLKAKGTCARNSDTDLSTQGLFPICDLVNFIFGPDYGILYIYDFRSALGFNIK